MFKLFAVTILGALVFSGGSVHAGPGGNTPGKTTARQLPSAVRIPCDRMTINMNAKFGGATTVPCSSGTMQTVACREACK